MEFVTIRIKRRWLRVAALVAAGALVAFPAGVYASHQFTDVPASHTFHDHIEWIKDNNITAGCGGTEYCPDDPVTRGQMAAFMKKLAKKGVVNAGTLDGLDSSEFALAASPVQTWTAFDQSETYAAGQTPGQDQTILDIPITVADECGGGATTHTYLVHVGGSVGQVTSGDNTQSALARGQIRLDGALIETTESGLVTALVKGTAASQDHVPFPAMDRLDVAAGNHNFQFTVEGFDTDFDLIFSNMTMVVMDLGYTCA